MDLEIERDPWEEDERVPILDRSRLTLWQRRGELVVPIESLACSIPERIQRLRWRNAEVVRLVDLEEVAAIRRAEFRRIV
jgi:hypothetical protein